MSNIAPTDTVRVLVFSVTDGYRHSVIPFANQQIVEMSDRMKEQTGAEEVLIDVIDDPDGDASQFPDQYSELSSYHTIVWNSTTGSPLNEDQQSAFMQYIQAGGGYVGVHAASDTHYDWPWYGDLVGAYFDGHPDRQVGELNITDKSHPSTKHMPARYTLYDEFYDFHRNPRGNVHVLMTINEDSYEGAGMENGRVDHPMAWSHFYDGGRAWYTALGHTTEAFEDDLFLEHLLQGILWAGGFTEGDAEATAWDSYNQVKITGEIAEPMSMTIAPDGRIFLIQRTGEILIIPQTSDSDITTALNLDVYHQREDGGLGIVVDPDFEKNGWIYVYYSPANELLDSSEDMPYNLLSRFTVQGNSIDSDTEVEILRVHHTRAGGRHSGGDLQFGPDGSLWVSVGDDIGGAGIDGYTPTYDLDHETKTATDARGTAGDTSDLRGKILRIIPHEDGSYSIPQDNLFTKEKGYKKEIEAGLVRPEIFVMGTRNPFRFGVDSKTGWLYYADYGPDARQWSVDRGPIGIREYNQVREAGNAGWPMVRGPNIPYLDYDWENERPIAPFSPDKPINNSPFNKGLTELPPVMPATMYVPRHGLWDVFVNPPEDHPWGDIWQVPEKPPFPQLTDSAPNGGPMFRTSETHGPTALPAYYDGKWFIGEWSSGRILVVSFDDEGNFQEIEPFYPVDLYRPHDIEIGPNGHLYVLDYGRSWSGLDNPAVYRIDYHTEGIGSVEFDFELDRDTITPETTAEISSSIQTRLGLPVWDLDVSVSSNSEHIRFEAINVTESDFLAPDDSYQLRWKVSADEEISGGVYDISINVRYTDGKGNIRWIRDQAELTVDAPLHIPFAFNLGDESEVRNIEIQGLRFQQLPHIAVNNVHDSPEHVLSDDSILGTEHERIYQTGHTGKNLGYRISVPNGIYSLRLHFAEIREEVPSGENAGFDVIVQEDTISAGLNIIEQYGRSQAVSATLENVEVRDGFLNIELLSSQAGSVISGFEVRHRIDLLQNDILFRDIEDRVFDPNETIKLNGAMPGWIGTTPVSIDEVRNPILILKKGETYTIEWTNTDGVFHNFAIQDDDNDILLLSDGTSGVGIVETVEFTATAEMKEYICVPHPIEMRGKIIVVE